MPVMPVRNPIGIRVQADPNWQSFDDYFVKIEVSVEIPFRSTNFETIDSDIRGYPNQDGIIEFDIKRLIAPYLEADRPDPLLSQGVICEKANIRYSYELQEFQNGLLSAQISVSNLHAVRSGIHYTKGDPLSSQSLQSYVGEKFLTHMPTKLGVSCHQPIWLYVIVPLEVATIDLEVERIYADDSSDILNKFSTNVDRYDLVYFPAGYLQLDLENGATDDVKGWKVRVRDVIKDEYITEIQHFECDCICTPLDRFYLFENSLGGMDTLRTTGELAAGQKTGSEISIKSTGPFYDPSYGNLEPHNTEHQEAFVQHTGHITQEENLWLRDLLRAELAWRLGDWQPNPDASGDFWPILIERGQMPIMEDNNFLHGIPFKYSDAFQSVGL